MFFAKVFCLFSRNAINISYTTKIFHILIYSYNQVDTLVVVNKRLDVCAFCSRVCFQ